MPLLTCHQADYGAPFGTNHALDVQIAKQLKVSNCLSLATFCSTVTPNRYARRKLNILRTVGGLGSRLPPDRMKSELAQQKEDCDPRDDSNYIQFCEKLGLKYELLDDEQKCLNSDNLLDPTALDEVVEMLLRFSNAMIDRNCIENYQTFDYVQGRSSRYNSQEFESAEVMNFESPSFN